MPVRHEYVLNLAEANPPTDLCAPAGVCLRAVSLADAPDLAELMLDAYRNTIDYEGEEIAEAVVEVESYFTRASSHPAISQYSLSLGSGDSMVCACLLDFLPSRKAPFVGFVICRTAHKRKGFGTYALHHAICKLKQAGYAELRTIITEGNLPSETLFGRAGFKRVEPVMSTPAP